MSNGQKIECQVYKNKDDEDFRIVTLDYVPDKEYLKINYGFGSYTLYVYINGYYREKINYDII